MPQSVVRHDQAGFAAGYHIRFWKIDGKFCGRIGEFDDKLACLDFGASTEADARAKMLIYLIENNLMSFS